MTRLAKLGIIVGVTRPSHYLFDDPVLAVAYFDAESRPVQYQLMQFTTVVQCLTVDMGVVPHPPPIPELVA